MKESSFFYTQSSVELRTEFVVKEMNDLISILAIVDSTGMMLVMALNRSMNELFLFNGVLTNGFVFSFERIFLSCNQEIRLFLLLMMIVMNNRWRISISKMFR